MKWQIGMVAFAAAFALLLGTARWNARFRADAELSRAMEDGRWVLVSADNGATRELHGTSSPFEPLQGYAGLQAFFSGGFDLSEDGQRMAFVDLSNAGALSEPQLMVVDSRRAADPLVTVTMGTGEQFRCPLFDGEGSVLFLRMIPGHTWEMRRVAVPENGPLAGPAPTTSVMLPAGITADSCFELGDGGSVLAWLGTDRQIHVSRRATDGTIAPGTKYSGADFELAPDGSWLAVADGVQIDRVDVATGARSKIAAVKGSRMIAISPDGRWALASEMSSWSGGKWVAFRVSDGVEVPFSAGGTWYVGNDTSRVIWRAR